MSKPLAIDLCCGLGGWAEAFMDEGYRVIGYDTEAHDYGTGGYPGELRIRDIRTIHGSEFKDAAVIVASPPCQRYSYMAMPWSRAKAQAREIEADTTGQKLKDLNELFETCFRLQREASEAAGHYIPLIVENVRGAQKWVGRALWNYGSFYLWGDVPALMPHTFKLKSPGKNWNEWKGWDGTEKNKPASVRPWGDDVDGLKHDGQGWRENGTLKSSNRMVQSGYKVPGNNSPRRWDEREVQRLGDALKTVGHANIRDGVKVGGDWFGRECESSPSRLYGSKSSARKAASAMIAKIPFPLAQHIARTFKPEAQA